MANTKVKAVDVSGIGSVYSAISKNSTAHKSLDFSNVGMPQDTVSGKQAESNRSLRQFHQTRIYIQGFNNMRSHNAELTSTTGKSSTYLISANLPNTISYKLFSEWTQPFSFLASSQTNALMSFASGSLTGTKLGNALGLSSGISAVNRASTLKVWSGTKPLSLTLDIPVIDDNTSTNNSSGISTNFVEALEYLGSLCLPARDAQMGFYVPPPSPLNATIKWNENSSWHFKMNYGRIMVQLGGILLIDNCVIEGVDVTYPDTKTLIKHTYSSTEAPGSSGNTYLAPLLANVKITISTIEAMTASTYSKMLWLKPQNTGNFTADVQSALGKGKEIAGNLYDLGKETASDIGKKIWG